jgi:hypothetical protein
LRIADCGLLAVAAPAFPRATAPINNPQSAKYDLQSPIRNRQIRNLQSAICNLQLPG